LKKKTCKTKKKGGKTKKNVGKKEEDNLDEKKEKKNM
jgi:hypothetical protein